MFLSVNLNISFYFTMNAAYEVTDDNDDNDNCIISIINDIYQYRHIE